MNSGGVEGPGLGVRDGGKMTCCVSPNGATSFSMVPSSPQEPLLVEGFPAGEGDGGSYPSAISESGTARPFTEIKGRAGKSLANRTVFSPPASIESNGDILMRFGGG